MFPVFEGASYAERYRVLCERLMEKGLYQSAVLALSDEEEGRLSGIWESLSPATDLRSLFAGFAGHIAAALV